MQSVDGIRNKLAEKLEKRDFVIDKTGSKTIELIGESFWATEKSIFGEVNYDYADREIEWYESQSLYVNDIPGTVPKIWLDVASTEGKINSNYGYLIFSEENGNQYKNVLETLKSNRDSRRATMIYNRPSMHTDYNKNGMSDFICTNSVNYFIRKDLYKTGYSYTKKEHLVAIVQMRSNDAIFGYKNDFYWQMYVAKKLCKELEIPEENIILIWNAASLHVYERHFYLVNNFIRTGDITITLEDYKKINYIN
jgi:thymidylate synthase